MTPEQFAAHALAVMDENPACYPPWPTLADVASDPTGVLDVIESTLRQLSLDAFPLPHARWATLDCTDWTDADSIIPAAPFRMTPDSDWLTLRAEEIMLVDLAARPDETFELDLPAVVAVGRAGVAARMWRRLQPVFRQLDDYVAKLGAVMSNNELAERAVLEPAIAGAALASGTTPASKTAFLASLRSMSLDDLVAIARDIDVGIAQLDDDEIVVAHGYHDSRHDDCPLCVQRARHG